MAENNQSNSQASQAVGLQSQSILEHAGAIVSLCSALAVVAAATYSWGYFRRLGLYELEFVSLSDIVRSAISWLPSVVILTWLGWGIGTVLRKKAPPPKLGEVARYKYDYVIPGSLAFTAIFFYFRMPEQDSSFLFFVGLSWAAFCVLFTGIKSPMGVSLVILMPLSGIGAYVNGVNEANRDLSRTNYETLLDLKDPTTVLAVALFRYSDNGVLYRRASDRSIVFTAWPQIAHIAGRDIGVDMRPRVCTLVGFFCPQSTD